jgi:hypothetical protein
MKPKPWSIKERFELAILAFAFAIAIVMAVVLPTIEEHQVYLHSAAR